MTRSRAAAWVTLSLLLLTFGVIVVVTTPWHPLPGAVPGGDVHPDAARDFTAAQIARETSYHDAIRPWGLIALVISLLVPAVLGFTPLGRRMIGAARRLHWLLQLTIGVAIVVVLTAVVTWPIGAREHAIETHYGLTLQGWGGWSTDQLRGLGVALVATWIGVAVIVTMARRLKRMWWVAAAVLSAGLVFGGSFAYPYIVEPVFNNFHSLPSGNLRTELFALAKQDHQPLRDILVADASRRTTTENAYVSGFGASRRLVLYDTLLQQDTPDEIRVITAHELGHAKYDDVLHGTLEGALVVAAAMCALFLLLGSAVADPRRVPLLLALYVVVGFAVSPLTNVISRHIEARADAHALQLTADPVDYVRAQKQLALAGLDDLEPSPVLYALFFNHPSPPQRIAMARDWARQHGVAEP
ncbi:MAG TPA: M48 family metallopeptidase [Mycobacteriales bacterium]|nr:M48 family metallopeptidase [Mycobacteriales bacterium]